MDAFDNPARNGMAGPQRDGVSIDPTNQALTGQAATGGDLLAAAAGVTAAASAIPLAIQAIIVPDASGRIVLPAGVSIDDISVSGADLIITLPNGQVMIVPNGAIDIPAIVVDGDMVPASTVAQLLENLGELNPEAGIRSSGGNFADPEGAIQDPYALGDLLPYTELAFPQPENREIIPAIPEEEDPTVVIVTPDQPAGSTTATASVNEAGLPARGAEPAGSNAGSVGAASSTMVTGSFLIDTPDGAGSVTLNGTAITGVGQVFTTPLGQLVITSIAPDSIGYTYTLTDNSNANNNLTDTFSVVVTDIDGDRATADLTISIIDDVPTARADTDQVAAATFTPETGNVISGAGTTSAAAGADTPGADGAALTGIRAGTAGSEFAAPGGVIQGQYGTLTIDAQGNYSYVRTPGTPGGVSDVFTYRLTDGDGDTSTATLTVAIGDSATGIASILGTNIVDEAQLPPRTGEPAGSAFDGDSETTTGTFSFTSRDGVDSVTIKGVAVTPGALPQQIVSDATGTLVIDGYSYDPATGQGTIAYHYTLTDNVLNGNGSAVTFGIAVTDRDGDVAKSDLTIRIIDDAPTAVNDADSVSEDGPLTADGNVLTGAGGSDANATDGAKDIQGADGATVTAITGGTVGEGFATAYGTLTLNADGSYHYALNNAAQPVQGLSAGETLSETFTYTITDGDGDTSTATLTITINGTDDGVTINGLNVEGGELIVDEDDLANGSSPDAAALTQPGSFTIETPDGLGNVTIGGTQVVTNGVFTAGTATSPLGTVNITGFTPVVGADGSVIGGTFTYEYVLAANTLTHGAAGEDDVTDSFAVTVTDSDGSASDASLDVVIIDDVPAAANDSDSVTEDSGNGDNPATADGNVLTGAGGSDANDTDGAKDVQGADGAAVTAVTGGTVGEGFPTAYGTLTLNADGSYSYVLNNNAQPVQGLSAGETLSEVFTYTLTDGDGDTSTATLTIVINGADDGVTINGLNGEGGELFFDEDDLPARDGEPAGSDPGQEPVTDGGSFSVSTPDGMGAVLLDSFNGAPLGAPLTLVTADGGFTPQTVATAYGTLSITGFSAVIGADGSVIGGNFTYSYTLSDNRTDHDAPGEDDLTDSIGIIVTDSDGSGASATIDIRITDDVPAAIDDFQMQPVENQPVTINVVANDTQGADGVQPATAQLVEGSLTGGGTLVDNGDGSFTYNQTPGEVGEVSFQYQITDGDGDTSVATATIMLVADSKPVVRTADDAIVDEDGLPGANADNGLPGEVTSTGSASANGTITVDFGGDVPAALAGSLVLDDSAALDTQLTVDGVSVIFAKDGADLVGKADGQEVIRIALTTATAGPGAHDVTYGYTVTLSAAIDQAVTGSEDSAILSAIGFTATDNDGSPVSGAFGVTIIDDIPTLTVSDTPTHATEGGPAVGGNWSLDAGADGVESVTVTFGTGTDAATATLSLAEGSSVTIVQPTGTLTVYANHSFTFLATGDQDNGQNPSASFTLSAVDRDGDPASDTLTIAIDDGANPLGGDELTLTVDEAAIDGIGRTPASDGEIDSGTLSFTAGSDTLSGFMFDGVAGLAANLDGAGTDIFWTLSLDGQTITGSLTDGGPAAITISLTAPASVAPGATASATVTVTLADNLPHELAMAAQTQGLGTVTVQATDTDNDVATGVVTVRVTDDIPTISASAATADALTVDDSDLTANATADFGFGQPGSLFNVAFNADGPAAANAIVYTLDVKSAGVASGLIDSATGQAVLLTSEGGAIVGRTSVGGDPVFILSVDANGTVTLDQQRAVFHTTDTGPDQTTGLSAADLITLTATVTDGDDDTASATANIGGALTFKDDGVAIDIRVVEEAGVTLVTQDGDTIAAADTDVSTANFSGVFSAINADYGADGAGTTSWTYVLSLVGADGVSAQLASHGAPVFLYDIGGVITGSTATSAGAVDPGNTIFTLGVDAGDGTVTLTQFAPIDHGGVGVDSNFENQLAPLADGLVTLTGTVTIVDRDGDTDSASQSIDLGHNILFADDGPRLDITLKGAAELRIDETNGVVAAGTEVDPNATGSLGTATIAIADLYTATLDPGADVAASYSYAFVVNAGNPDSGYRISATDEAILLVQTGSGTVVGRGATSNADAFIVTVAADGTVTMTQLIAIEHGNTASNDETSLGMNPGALLLQVTATDFDGDFSRDTVDLGSIVRIEDDGPSISNVAGSGAVTLDETSGLDANVTSAAAVITADFHFGADGAATANSVVYGLSLTGNGTTSLTTAIGGFAISLVATSATTIVGRYTDGGVHDAFTVTINADGTLTVSQLVALEHPLGGAAHDDALTLDGLITASVTITDSDGDSITATKPVGAQVTFLDDGPSVTATAAGGALVLNDESATISMTAAIATGDIIKGDDLDVGGPGAISIHTSGAAVVTATPNYGTDGAAESDPLSYALTVTSATSGLTTTDGSPITLVQVGDVIVGQVSGGAFGGQAAFAIAINPTTGVVTVEQYLSLGHPDAANPDDMVQLLAGTLGVVVTATDSDGDVATSNTVDISEQIRFDDDGPAISNVADGASVTLDESGGFDTMVSAAPVITADFAYGADGAAAGPDAAVYGIALTTLDPDLNPLQAPSGLATAVGDHPITLVEIDATTIVGRYTDGGLHDAFTISIGTDGKLTVTQLVALEHLQDGEVALHNDALTLTGLISASVTIKDGDGDTATKTTEIGDQITFLDDGPTAHADTNTVTEGAIIGGNVLTGDSFGADGPDATLPVGGVVGVRAGTDISTPVLGGTGSLISTSYGDLTLNADGSYSYDAKPNTTATVITDSFVYTIRDADGDTSTTTLTITIQPVTLMPDNQTRTVDEAALDLFQADDDVAAGTVTGSNPTATTETVTGTLAVTGAPGITYAVQDIDDALGRFVLNSDGTYTYTLKSAFDGPTIDNDVTTENGVRVFHYVATDANGNSIPGTITIDIIDDVPTARPDTATVTEDTASVATGNVITGVDAASADTQGADGAAVTGVVAGTPAGDATGNVGAALNGSYGSLTLGANGGYTYTLNNGNPVVQALGVTETLTETFTYTLTDGDGDRTTTTLTITIKGSNDLPTITPTATAVSDEGLAGGFPDETGTVDTNDFPVRIGTITATDPDGDTLTFSLGTPATALSSGGQPIVWDTTNPQLLLGTRGAGGPTIISVAINNSGAYTVTLLGPIDHPNTAVEDALSLVVPVKVYDGTTTVTNTTALTIGLEDDAPIAIAPLSAALVNAPGSTVYQSLDADGDVDNNYGGDGPGSVIFNAATIAALQAQNLTSGGQALNYVLSAGGTVLTAEKPGGADVFIIRLQPADHTDQYQVEMFQKLDSTQTVDFNSGGYNFVGGNTAWIGFVKPGDNDSQDILVTPMTGGIDGGKINANANEVGVSDGQSVGSNEAVRIDFVVDLTGSPGNNDYGPLANQNHAFDSHYTANGASAFFTSISGSTNVRLVARDDIDTDNDVGDGVKDVINKVAISYNGSTLLVTAAGSYTVGGHSFAVSFSGGEATVTGVVENTRIAGFTADGYNSIEFHYAGGDTFKIGDFGAVVQTENPVNFNVPVTIVDGDGDSAPGSLAITTASPLLVIGSATGDTTGQTADHVVANPQGQVDGVIQGGNFDDTLVGDPGSVTITEGQQANVVLVLDSSGSMSDEIAFGGGTISRMQALKNGVNALIDSLSQSGAKDVRVTVIDFDSSGSNLGTFNLIVNGVVQTAAITAAKAAVNGMDDSGGTNYEDGLQDALSWITGGNGIAGADVNKVVFVSDGNPTRWNSGGDGSEDSDNVQAAMNEVLGIPDGTNEPQQILATGYSIDSIGINVNATLLTRLGNVEDGNASGGTGSATNATSAEQLASILQNLGGSTDLAAAGNDVVNGGDGGDVIFGDVLFTNALATQLGVNLPAGSGWAVFQTLEGRPGNESIDPAGNGADWNRQDTIAYIRANHAVLGQESGRTGGNDTITAGAGNDIVYGQEGNDTIDGGTGNDLISGGTGRDVLTGGTGSDTFTVNAGESRATLGGSGNAGTIAGHDRITDFNITTDTLNLPGTPVAVGNGAFANDSVLTIGGATIKSHSVTNGVMTFDDANTFGSALTITTDAQVAAVVDYLQRNDIGAAGTTVAFAAGGRTFVYQQVGAAQNSANDILVELTGTTIANLTTLIGTRIAPVTLDLDGDGLHFAAASAGGVFDYDGDGVREATSWAGSGDGVLVRDANADGIVNNGSEIIFSVGGSTDLEGLRLQYDSNGDGRLSAADTAFASFGVWQDANGNGITDAGEFRSLADLGIASIALTSDGKPYLAADGEVLVHGEASFTRTDGRTGAVGDVTFITTRAANDVERTTGNQALTNSLVAASLVAVVHHAQPDGVVPDTLDADDAPLTSAPDAGAVLAVADPATETVSGLAKESAPTAALDPAPERADAPHADEPAAAAAIDAAQDSGRGAEPANDDRADAADSLADLIAARAPADHGTMDGLLSLAALPAETAVATVAAADGPAAQAVLAEVLEGRNAVDHIIDAVTGGKAVQVAADEAPAVNLAHFLDQQVAPHAVFAATPSLEQDLHQMAAA